MLEGTRSGLIALRHLLALATRPPPPVPAVDVDGGAVAVPAADRRPLGAESLALLADYGITVGLDAAGRADEAAVAAAETIGYPVVMKTDAPRSRTSATWAGSCSAWGRRPGARGYARLADAHGVDVTIHATAPRGSRSWSASRATCT